MLKTLGWVAVGLIIGVLARGWLDHAPGPADGVDVDAHGGGDDAALRERVSELEKSDAVMAGEYADLARRAATLQDQVNALSAALDVVTDRRPGAATADLDPANADDSSPGEAPPSAPANLSGIEAIPGAVLVYEITGSTRGSIWGTDVYTDDSSIAVAAVHAGVLQPDETGTVMLTVLPGREAYRGSVRHGVESNDYRRWARSYTLLRLY